MQKKLADKRAALVLLMWSMRQHPNKQITTFVRSMELYAKIRRSSKPSEKITYRNLVKDLRALEAE